jgi:hypothetical protein
MIADRGILKPAAPTRRGNTMVLVVGILVLLAIIATSYLTRTHAGRVTAISQQRASLRDDNNRVVAEFLAREIAEALFVRPIDPSTVTPGQVANSNALRLSLGPMDRDGDGFIDYVPLRYGVDPADFRPNGGIQGPNPGPDGIADYPYNFAPYWVVPYTNWPDGFTNPFWPGGPGNPNGGTFSPNQNHEGNPLGNPGFADSRWLADLEPLRITLPGPDGVFGTPDDFVAYSHWRHLTNIARPDNGWRLCVDISDVTDYDGDLVGGIVTDLSVPSEQWLVVPPFKIDSLTGDSIYPDYFWDQWLNWFDFNQYQFSYTVSADLPNAIPANFYNLDNLDGGIDNDGDGNFTDWYERPEAEFIRDPASLRWNVSRVLADADGDGFTDSFWFLAPATVERGIRQVVAVRIVDNSAMMNVSTATGFVRRDPVPAVPQPPATRTEGLTPADVALTGELLPYDAWLALADPDGHWNVGFYDNPLHWYDVSDDTTRIDEVRYDDAVPGGVDPADLWARHLQEIGLYNYVSLDPADPDFLKPDHFSRIAYWRQAGLSPLLPDPASPFTPYGLPEEIELRMFHGNNYPWIYSRLEHTTQAMSNAGYGFLRGSPGRAESTEYRLQLFNRDLVGDSRHRVTVYNGARNEIMPPWLWPSPILPLNINIDDDAQPADDDDLRQIMALNLKYDLRRPEWDTDVDGDGVAGEQVTGLFPSPYDDDINNDRGFAGGGIDERDHHALIRERLYLALIDYDADPDGLSYFGTDLDDVQKAERMATSMTANILAYRDTDIEPLVLNRAMEWRDPMATDTLRYVGLEAQPFLVEAFIAHVFEYGEQATRMHFGLGDAELIDIDDYILCLTSDESTIVAVQIANPFDRPVSLDGFVLDVFGQSLDFQLAGLSAQPLAPGQARTFYSMENDPSEPVDFDKWKTLLGIVDGPDVVDVTGLGLWGNSRMDYAGADADHAVELLRKIDDGFGTPVPVVVDRIDIKPGLPDEPAGINRFGESFLSMPRYDGTCVEPDGNEPWFDVKNLRGDTHYVQMVRASRAWEVEFNGQPGINPDERNPRYVFASRLVEPSARQFTSADPAASWFSDTDLYPTFSSPDNDVPTVSDRLHFAMQMLQKDADFEQVGELLNVWAFGHELRFDAMQPGGTYQETTSTFSEFLWDEIEEQGIAFSDRPGVNRLRLRPIDAAGGKTIGHVIGKSERAPTDPRYLLDPMHRLPGLPAGARVLDAFVCDGGGVSPGDVDLDGIPDTLNDEFLARLGLANGYSGRMTPGLINLNTAPPEVLRALPHWARVVHETGLNDAGVMPVPTPTPRGRLPEAAVQYRERFAGFGFAPDYTSREALLDGLRPDRGFATPAELMLLDLEPVSGDAQFKKSWRIDAAGDDPFDLASNSLMPAESTRISTDVVGGSNFDIVTPTYGPDKVAGDVEESNLLYTGVSNLVTTRSDVFTVYFKVRSFRQNPATGRWDATDPEMIVDESRFVMLVDRSEVDRPNEKPRILYLEKLPR